MTYDAFISYRRSDRITADGVARFLDAFGLKVFVDRSSRAGTAWEPELRAALASAKVLVVLWSRSSARSDWVEQEWRNVAPGCRIVPIKLDGEKLPEDLDRLTAVEGLDVGSRLLQRTFELMQQGKLNPVQAQEQLVQELAADGIVLEQKKRDALGVLLSFAAGLSIALAVTQLGDAVPAAPTDSLQPAARSTPPPGSGARSWASFFGALSASAAAAFCVGYWWREPAPAPLAAGERPAPPAGATITAAATCPPVATCTPCEPAKSPDCPCSREQCGRKAAPSPALDEQRSSLQACQQQLTTATRALNACNQGKQPSRSTSTTITRATPMLAVGGSASTPILR